MVAYGLFKHRPRRVHYKNKYKKASFICFPTLRSTWLTNLLCYVLFQEETPSGTERVIEITKTGVPAGKPVQVETATEEK